MWRDVRRTSDQRLMYPSQRPRCPYRCLHSLALHKQHSRHLLQSEEKRKMVEQFQFVFENLVLFWCQKLGKLKLNVNCTSAILLYSVSFQYNHLGRCCHSLSKNFHIREYKMPNTIFQLNLWFCSVYMYGKDTSSSDNQFWGFVRIKKKDLTIV